MFKKRSEKKKDKKNLSAMPGDLVGSRCFDCGQPVNENDVDISGRCTRCAVLNNILLSFAVI